MLRKIATVIGVMLLGVLVFAATKPNDFRIERSTIINAPPDRVYAFLDDFHRWSAWSPWEKLDPAMRRAMAGPASGRGAVYAWEGNKKVGKGRMEILEAVPPSKVVVKLDFLAPFEAHNVAAFALDTAGSATRVTWAMYGPQPYMSKLMCVFVNMDKMVGKDFEAGLANLKAQVER